MCAMMDIYITHSIDRHLDNYCTDSPPAVQRARSFDLYSTVVQSSRYYF